MFFFDFERMLPLPHARASRSNWTIKIRLKPLGFKGAGVEPDRRAGAVDQRRPETHQRNLAIVVEPEVPAPATSPGRWRRVAGFRKGRRFGVDILRVV